MSRSINIDWDKVPDASVVPAGRYELKVEIEDDTENRDGRLSFKAEYEIQAPAEFAGQRVFDNFTIGTTEDPDADEPATLRRYPLRKLKQLLVGCGLELNSDLDAMVEECNGQVFVGMVELETGRVNKDTGENYPDRNNVRKFYALGEAEVGIDDTEEEAPAKTKKKEKATKKKSKPAPEPDDDDDDDEEAPEPEPKKKAKKGKKVACPEDGCDWTGTKDEFTGEHIDNCEFGE